MCVLLIKGAISRKWQGFEKMAQKSILTFHWLKIHHWNALTLCACHILALILPRGAETAVPSSQSMYVHPNYENSKTK